MIPCSLMALSLREQIAQRSGAIAKKFIDEVGYCL